MWMEWGESGGARWRRRRRWWDESLNVLNESASLSLPEDVAETDSSPSSAAATSSL